MFAKMFYSEGKAQMNPLLNSNAAKGVESVGAASFSRLESEHQSLEHHLLRLSRSQFSTSSRTDLICSKNNGMYLLVDDRSHLVDK